MSSTKIFWDHNSIRSAWNSSGPSLADSSAVPLLACKRRRRATWKSAAGLGFTFLRSSSNALRRSARFKPLGTFPPPRMIYVLRRPLFHIAGLAKDASMFMQIVFDMKQQEIMSTHIKRVASLSPNIGAIRFALEEGGKVGDNFTANVTTPRGVKGGKFSSPFDSHRAHTRSRARHQLMKSIHVQTYWNSFCCNW